MWCACFRFPTSCPGHPADRASYQEYYCAYVGSFGEFACNPRTLSSSHLNHMVSLEGIVTKCSLVRPKIIKSMHYSEVKKTFLEREYQDQTMTASGAASTSVYPQQDADGNPVYTPSQGRLKATLNACS